MFSTEFLAMVRCPENRQPLALADAQLVEQLNRALAAGRLKNRCGQTLTQPLDGGFMREDQSIVYPVIDGIPILLIDEGIPLAQLHSPTART